MNDPPDQSANVVLTGFMGTGKTTVGRLLAALLDKEFIDTDALIEARHGPIPEIFATQGENRFRHLERNLAAELAQRRGLVISTGGRLMLDSANVEALSRTGRVFCLTASVETILSRVGAAHGRPLLSGSDPAERISSLLAERAEGYNRFHLIDTDGLEPAVIAGNIVDLLRAD